MSYQVNAVGKAMRLVFAKLVYVDANLFGLFGKFKSFLSIQDLMKLKQMLRNFQ